MEKMYNEKINQFTAQKETEIKSLEDRLRTRHLTDMQAQMTAHRIAIETAHNEAEKKLEQEIRAKVNWHKEEINNIRRELQQKHAEELEEAGHEHQLQIQAARMELDRAIEIARQKEGDYAIKISELQDELRGRQERISEVESEIQHLQKGMNELGKELKAKGKEILRVRSEANNSLRMQEEQLVQKHSEELNELSADHLRDKQDMLAEFNTAQEILKEKISSLKNMLEEAEEQYLNRESRPEDLEKIERLHEALMDREAALKKLLDEKKFYQMELVNRETNFNKVFSAAPNVGVLNPLQVKRGKASDRHSKQSHTAAGSTGRLDPLPGSPLHEERFNPNRPLPPMSKKFVK